MRPLVAHCHFGLSKACHRAGERQRADEHLSTATTMFHEMGMTFRRDQAGTWMDREG
jgi:hypothetical protein